MSFPEYKLELSKEADNDFESILIYTFNSWGKQQLLSYRTELKNALHFIRSNPLLGQRHPELPDGYRYWRGGSHIIVYRLEKDIVFVLRILHGRMNIAAHITEKPH